MSVSRMGGGRKTKKERAAQHFLDLGAAKSNSKENKTLLHELEIYQLELEMQNQELLESRRNLVDSRDRYENLFDFAPVGIVTLDEVGVVKEINLAAADILGVERARFNGWVFARWVAKKDVQKFRQHLRKCQRSGPGERVRTELDLMSSQMVLVPVELTSIKDLGELDNPVYRTAVIDQTEYRRIEAEREESVVREREARKTAEHANRAKDEFFAIISHELRTPLNVILGWVDILHDENLDAQTFAKAVETLDRNAHVQKKLIEDLLEVSRIITGKMNLDTQPLDFTSLVSNVVASIIPRAQEKKIAVKCDLPKNSVAIAGDANRLTQVVSNLLDNAIKFTPLNGKIFVELFEKDLRVHLVVRDTGKGIVAEFLPKVFDSLKQEDMSTTRNHGGLGLGLAIARHISERHGGTISAYSAGPNTGATFEVVLPILKSVSVLPKRTSIGLKPGSNILNGIKVLIVDDSADVLALLALWLTKGGAQVQTASSAESAVEEFQYFRPDILLTDIGMPGEDGYSLIRKIRSMGEAGANMPAAALTAYAREEERVQALNAGFQMHLSKPVSEKSVVEAVRRLVGE